MMSAVVVEFLGTLLLIGAVAFGHNPLLIVAALATAIAFGAKVSGANFNPAITVYSWMSGKLSQTRAVSYIGAQLAAGVTIALMANVF